MPYNRPSLFFNSILAAASCLILTGCAAGPDFRSPRATASYPEYLTTLPPETEATPVEGGKAQRFHKGRDIPAEWWCLFNSTKLDRLIREALLSNPTLDAAEASLRRAEENRRARFGTLLPGADLNLVSTRQRITGATFGQPDFPGGIYSLHNASVRVSYAIDLFGGIRRSLEDLQAHVDFERFQLEAARLALTTNIVTSAIREASIRDRMAVTRRIIATDEETLSLVSEKHRLGGASLPEVLAQEAHVAESRAAIPPLEKDLAENRHLLALLTGKTPDEAMDLPEFTLADMELPLDLPVSLPSDLVRGRPDIRAAEELLHSASALVGVSTADLYPQITLSGSYGSEATELSGLFSSGTSVWNLGSGLLQPLFRGGELMARRRAVLAAHDEASARYRETVLAAFKEVADVLRAVEKDAETLAALAVSEKAARDTFDLARKQFEIGSASWLSVLDAQRRHEQGLLLLVQARAARLSDAAALFQALGGGWWNRKPREDSEEGG